MPPSNSIALARPPAAHAAAGSRLRVAHVVAEYLPRSATFIYTAIRFQRDADPVVLAGHVTNVAEFPMAPVVELFSPDVAAPRRALRRLVARANGCPTTAAHRIWAEARAARCDVLHAHFGPMGYDSLIARRRLGIPLVTTFYGRDLALGETDPTWDHRYTELFAEGEAFVCEGPAMAAHLEAIGCPAEKIHLVRIGLDLSGFPFDPAVPDGPPIVLQTARFVEKKGIDLSVRAFARAHERLGEAELWLIGDGPERPAVEALVEELGVGAHVRFLGSVSHAEYRDALARAHVLIQPSRTASDGDTEGGAPTVLIEAQAIGLPVVATRHADIPFVVADPERLVDEEDVDGLADAVVQVVRASHRSPSERTTATRDARAFVEQNHEAACTARQYRTIYESARASAGPAPSAAR